MYSRASKSKDLERALKMALKEMPSREMFNLEAEPLDESVSPVPKSQAACFESEGSHELLDKATPPALVHSETQTKDQLRALTGRPRE